MSPHKFIIIMKERLNFMFSIQKLKQYVKDILFPPFSERELVTLAYLIALFFVVAVITDPAPILSAIVEFAKRLTFHGPNGFIAFITAILGAVKAAWYGLIGFVVVVILYDIAIEQRKVPLVIKKFVAYLFYTALSLLSIATLLRYNAYALVESFVTPLFTRRLDVLAFINNAIMGFLFLRSMVTLLLTYAYGKSDKEHLLGMRMTDEQVSHAELAMIIVCATAIFLFLSQGHDRLVAVLLSYFYTTLLLDIYRKIFPQPDPALLRTVKDIKLK